MEENRLKIIRKDLDGITQTKLSELLGISLHKIRDAESGKTKITPEIARAIEEKLNFSLKWVLTGEGQKKKEASRPAPPLGADHDVTYEEYNLTIDPEIAEIVDILQSDLPEFKSMVLKMLRGRKEFKEGLKRLGGALKEEE